MNAQSLTTQILELRQHTNAFKESIRTRSEKMSWTFYDGPPFTSGDPHYGHLLQSIVKDMVPRRMTMRGYRIERKRGWDCHGIPAENFVNKKLGITSKKQVEEEFGLKNYIEACRTMVNEVNTHRKRTVDHIGRWVDMENAYFTMDNEFMESVICVFSDLYHRNLIYKGFKVLGYSRALGTALSNSEIAEGYEMRQDPAVTVKFALEQKPVEVVCGVIKDEAGRTLMIYENRHNAWYFPGGKIEVGETPADALKREISEEIGVEVLSEQFLGHAKTIHKGKLYRLHYFAVTIEGTPTIQEPHNHGMIEWIAKIPSENMYGYVLKFADNIISDDFALRHDFADIHMLEQGLIGNEKSGDTSVSILPWTTTPWTLPANMFAAVHRDIEYIQIFDKTTQEYYVLAEACLSKYYKNTDEYTEIGVFKGEELIGMTYTPLYDYIKKESLGVVKLTSYAFISGQKSIVNAQNSAAQKNYEKFFHILHADFVTTDSGTGIVHEAPAFGADDYDLVASHLGRDNAQEWLFDPVNEYGEFTTDATDFTGMNVFDANSEIIKNLKSRGLLIKQETYNHSYPHCPRTKTPLIYKAIESRFVKEDDLKALTVPAVESMHMVPETVKNRFVEGLKSAPDRNISRTRFRGAPLPVWVSDDGLVTKVVGSIEEIYQLNKPTKQLTKIIVMRHGRTDYNEKHRIDCLPADKSRVNDLGSFQAEQMGSVLNLHDIDVLYCSPLTRCKSTLQPLLDVLGKECVVDERLQEFRKMNFQDKPFDCDSLTRDGGTDGGVGSESVQDVAKRVEAFFLEILAKHPGQTVVVCTHGDPACLIRRFIWNKSYEEAKQKLYLNNKERETLPYAIEYVRSETGKALDLHRPYIDDVVLIDPATDKTLKRIPEVLDCWFESGSMPYGQDHFMKKGAQEFTNCANFIAEGLDQTRGWFRALHVLGHAYHGQNVFQNVVVTGMILAEDGKKMSKSLQNFPDPTILINQYGADALRLYLLSSPVVRAEPLRFSEKGVEQMLKDVVIPLQNVFNFFKMYAEADKRQDSGTQVWFMRHALKAKSAIKNDDSDGESDQEKMIPLSEEGFAQLNTQELIEMIIRINPDVVVYSDFLRTQQTVESIQKIIAEYTQKEVVFEQDEKRGNKNKHDSAFDTINSVEEGAYDKDAGPISEIYQQLIQKYQGKRILIVSHKRRFRYLRQRLCNIQENMHTSQATAQYQLQFEQPIQLPLTPIHNELDQRVLAELHRTIAGVDEALAAFQLEVATARAIAFVEKVTNRYLRRSRRRFWSEEMSEDKQQAYQTLYTVISTYCTIIAPFAPFVTESLWQELGAFTARGDDHPSIHLQSRPIASPLYINETLIEEIETVRKIIKGALYLRAKTKIKVKQPLLQLQCKV